MPATTATRTSQVCTDIEIKSARTSESWHSRTIREKNDPESSNRNPASASGRTVAVLCTIVVHALALMASVRLFRRERKRGLVGSGFLPDIGIAVLTISFALVAHLVEIALGAALFVMCGKFKSLAIAYYHSAVNYTTLGYGDLIMTPSWKLLGPLEAADGSLMFGVSTAMIFAIAQRLVTKEAGRVVISV